MAKRPVIIARIRATALGILAVAGLTISVEQLKKFGALDPFESYRNLTTLEPTIGVRMEGVTIRRFHNGMPNGKLYAGRLDVSRDRHSYLLHAISKGSVSSNRGPISFEAGQGTIDSIRNEIRATNGVKASNADFQLKTAALTFSDRKHLLVCNAPVSGILSGGNLTAASFEYDSATGDTDIRGVTWTGSVSEFQETGQKPHIWEITGDAKTRSGKEIYSKAVAKDGEVIIVAPNVVRDPKTDILTATGNVTYFSGKANVRADKAVIYRKERRAVFSGNVIMFVKAKKDQDQPPAITKLPEFPTLNANKTLVIAPKGDATKDDEVRSSKNLREYPTIIRSSEITYWYKKGERRATIEGSPEAHQDFTDGRWRHGWTHHATYDGEGDRLRLMSSPGHHESRLRNSIGDDMTAAWIDISTKDSEGDDNEDIDASDTSSKLVDRSEDDSNDDKKNGSKTPKPGTNPPLTKPDEKNKPGRR